MLARTPSGKYCALLFPQVGCAALYQLSSLPAISTRWQQCSDGCPQADCVCRGCYHVYGL